VELDGDVDFITYKESLMSSRKVRIAVAGLGFGASFAEIYRAHPDVAEVGLCEMNPALQARFDAERFPQRHSDFDEMISSGRYDAVHICLPVTQHAEPTLAALRKGLHVACAVPMSHTVEDLQRIVETQKVTGLNYMMMETMIYGREYLYAKELLREGRLGEI
jgi:predicted dehydrogenase